ncbi:KMT5A-like protein [Mya arenaria]|uniref:KMT5A-like protein n=1 Tax=Mya arenaria TaxID=6604 RepID=A0ABY7FDY0_MYAAR|nr:KMT5A-like protein [Mya arenaria]
MKKKVRASLSVNSFQQKKRTTPIQDARFWCETGLDKNGFKKQYIDKDIGYGVFATTDFKQSQFLLEYVGSSICTKEAARRSRLYTRQNKSSLPRCYMYYFHFKGEERIDATADTQRLAKFVNDAPLRNPKCNAKMKLVVFGGRPRLCLFALRDIKFGEEIRYDYGEDDRLLFWRSKATTTKPEGGKRKATEQEDSDDDPFDVEQERNQQQPKQHQTSDEHDIEVLWRQENALDNTLLGKIGSNSLLKSSFFYLKNTLTDEIIDSYMSLIVRGRNVLYIDTITATNIFEGRLEKTNLLRNEIIEEYDVCFAVVNENGGHWVLLIILGKEREIIYVNPQGETESSVQDYCNHWQC